MSLLRVRSVGDDGWISPVCTEHETVQNPCCDVGLEGIPYSCQEIDSEIEFSKCTS